MPELLNTLKFRRYWLLAGWSWIIWVWYLSLTSMPPTIGIEFFNWDKLNHPTTDIELFNWDKSPGICLANGLVCAAKQKS